MEKMMAAEGILAQRTLITKLEAQKFGWDIVVGDAFVRGMRDIGYKSTAFALAELIDNSIQASATQVDIAFGYDAGIKPTKIALIDDGHGMEPKMVRACLIWGAGTRADNREGFGKYGYGLPSASVSQCERVTVYSRTDGGEWHSAYLDIKEISDGKWNNENRIETPAEKREDPPAFVVDYLAKANRTLPNHGTIVVWERADRLDYKTQKALRDNLMTQLGVTYRNFLVATPMTVDGLPVEPCDPLFLTPGFRYYDLDDDRAVALEPAVVEVMDKATKAVIGRMRVRYARMPATFFRVPEQKHNHKAGKGGTNARLDVADANNGIVFLRNGRQIDVVRPPRTLASFNATTDRFWAVEVDFDATLDDYFSITTSKQQIRPNEAIWDALRDKAKIWVNIAAMRKEYKKEADVIKVKAEERKKASIEAIEAAKKFKTTKPPADTPNRNDEAARNQQAETNRRAAASGVDPATVEKELVAEQEGQPLKVETEDLPGAPFFKCIQRGGQRVLLLNSASPFYTDVYAGPDTTVRTRAGLEILLWALGEAEVDLEPGSDRRRFYERERATVWSPYVEEALLSLRTISIVESTEDDSAA